MRKTLLLSWLIFLAATTVAQNRKLGMYAIGFYNLENLFDTEHDLNPYTGEDKNDYEYLPDGANQWTQMKYEHKLAHMARALSDMGTERLKGLGCALIGVSEVENAHCLSDLCAQPPLAERGMKFAHIEGPDTRGVDCGLLYNPRFFQPAKTWLQPYILNEHITRPTRGFLTVQGTLGGDSITVIVCHWPSRGATSPAREAAGTMVCALKDSIIQANPQMKILVMGDMNDDPFNESMAKCLKARRKMEDATEGQMYNPFWQILLDGHGTLTYQGGWNLFDQIVMTPNCLDVKGKKDYKSLTFYEAKIQRFPYLFQSEGKYKGSPKRTHAAGVWLDGYSDHLPVVTYFVKER